MITLKADNRIILKDAKFSFLSSNHLSGVTTFSMVSTTGLTANDYILAGELNSETSEIIKITSVDSTTSITIPATVYAHSESTKITRIIYNQVKFFRTTTAVFSAGSPLPATNPVNIDCQSFFTKYEDSVNSTGFGWFYFYNSTSTLNSSPSNAIPYTDFAENSAYKIIKRFLSSLNNSEMKLLTFDDVFSYLSEGYGIAKTELNLANQEFTTESQTITIISGTAEYDLEDTFAKLVSVSNSNGDDIDYLKLENLKYHEENETDIRYYLRGRKIGFSPTPTASDTYYAYYNANSSALSSYYENVELPNNNFYILNNFLLYKSAPKLGMNRAEALSYKKMFDEDIAKMKINSVKQSANKDSFDISPEACV